MMPKRDAGDLFCPRCRILEQELQSAKDQILRVLEDRARLIDLCENQLMRATARNSDPDTSHEATAGFNRDSGRKLRAMRKVVLGVFLKHGEMTDDAAWRIHRQVAGHEVPKASTTKRRLELQRMGLIEYAGRKAKCETGSTGMVWKVTDVGRDLGESEAVAAA